MFRVPQGLQVSPGMAGEGVSGADTELDADAEFAAESEAVGKGVEETGGHEPAPSSLPGLIVR